MANLKIYNTEQLSKEYAEHAPLERIRRLYEQFAGKKIVMTSSFGIYSAILIDLISECRVQNLAVYFIDTGYHFKETIEYKDTLSRLYKLNVFTLRSERKKHLSTLQNELWKTDPDSCCFINKVEPAREAIKGNDIWISGISGFQDSFRSKLSMFDISQGILKFAPLIDCTEEFCKNYLISRNIPPHPLSTLGYESIGCTHCTIQGIGRSGRWLGKEKTECGLHTAAIIQKTE